MNSPNQIHFNGTYTYMRISWFGSVAWIFCDFLFYRFVDVNFVLKFSSDGSFPLLVMLA